MSGKRPTREQLIELAKSDPEAIADLVFMLWDRVEALEALEAKVAELERNSRSSSKPPSTDKVNFANPPRPKSLRRKSGRKPGGQKGHRGDTLRQSDSPDRVVEHRLDEAHLVQSAAQHLHRDRQEHSSANIASAARYSNCPPSRSKSPSTVHGKRNWLHVFSTAVLTCYHIDAKRGSEAMLRMGLLEHSAEH